MLSEHLLNLARDRCNRHRDTDGFCVCCLEAVLVEAVLEMNEGLSKDAAVEVVLAWVPRGERDVH